ncbi:hypothetical protein T11_7633 [Trichinella zimbabwensis]|uniref:Uncharacterized protein n=1 Tax=Trichinella zimbabwensis TaxID=268475 RepID=A0A0V1HIW8_9BILA|nr:hypothetical protein T11_7633 [Trichinella zimbabwensis]
MLHGSSAVTPNLLQCADVIHCCQIKFNTYPVIDRWDYGDKTDGWRGCWVGEGVKREIGCKEETESRNEGEEERLGRKERREEDLQEYEEKKERILYRNHTGKLDE